jgi:hypothetical protein
MQRLAQVMARGGQEARLRQVRGFQLVVLLGQCSSGLFDLGLHRLLRSVQGYRRIIEAFLQRADFAALGDRNPHAEIAATEPFHGFGQPPDRCADRPRHPPAQQAADRQRGQQRDTTGDARAASRAVQRCGRETDLHFADHRSIGVLHHRGRHHRRVRGHDQAIRAGRRLIAGRGQHFAVAGDHAHAIDVRQQNQ